MTIVATKQGFAFLCGIMLSCLGSAAGTELPDILKHPVSQRTFAGDSIRFEVGANPPPLQYQWYKDGQAIAGAQTESLDLSNVLYEDVGNYQVIVTNAFGSYTSDAATLTLTDPSFHPGTFDPTFYPSTLNREIVALLSLPDGSLLAADKDRRLVKLDANGQPDPDFNRNASGPNDRVRTMALVGEDRVLLSGDFTVYNDTACHHLCMIHLNGALHDAFENTLGVNDSIRAFEVASSGKLLIGGSFTAVNGSNTSYLARLEADGTLDQTFSPDPIINRRVAAIGLTADGEILVAGLFSERFVRLNATGGLDPSFPDAALNADVDAIRVQSTGQVVLGGRFSTVQGERRVRLARLHPDGQIDLQFPNLNPDSAPTSLHLDSNDRILVTGEFRRIGESSHPGFVRLLSTGQVDPEFISLPLPQVETAALETATGHWLIGGDFQHPRKRLLRVRGEFPKEGFPPQRLTPIIRHTPHGTISVNARAYPAPRYTWRVNGLSLPEQSHPELPLDMPEGGLYEVTASNAFGRSEISRFTIPAASRSPFQRQTHIYKSAKQSEIIPNKIAQSLTSIIHVEDDFIVDRVTLTMDISHDAIDQLKAELFAPGKGSPTLLFKSPGPGRNLIGTGFDDASPILLSEGIAPFLGNFAVAEGSLRQLAGNSASGEWRLKIDDSVQTSGSGALIGWSLQLQSKASDVRFQTWSTLGGGTDFLAYALAGESSVTTGSDRFGNVMLNHRRWRSPEDIIYQYQTSNDLSQWRVAKDLRIFVERTSDAIEDVRVIWNPFETTGFLRLRTLSP